MRAEIIGCIEQQTMKLYRDWHLCDLTAARETAEMLAELMKRAGHDLDELPAILEGTNAAVRAHLGVLSARKDRHVSLFFESLDRATRSLMLTPSAAARLPDESSKAA